MKPSEHEKMYRAEARHFWFVGTRAVVLRLLQQRLGRPLNGATVLDLGCGTGYTMTRLPPTAKIVGLDYSATALALSHRRAPDASLVRGTAYALPFHDGAFDAVLALDVLEHLDDDSLAAREIRRVLKPGGTAVISAPAFDWLRSGHDDALEHRRRYSLPELEAVLADAGLRLTHSSYFNSLLFPPIAAKRLLDRALRGGGEPKSDLTIPAPPLNWLFARILAFERYLAPRFRVPLGVSCLVAASAPA